MKQSKETRCQRQETNKNQLAEAQRANYLNRKRLVNRFLSLGYCLVFVSCLLVIAPSASAALPETLKILEEIPVQHNGRVKPFQSFAEESVRSITGLKHDQGVSATQHVWNWVTNPDEWSAKPIIQVAYRPLRKEFSVMLVNHKVSNEILMKHPPFLERIEQASAKQKTKQDLSLLEKESMALYEKAHRFNEIGLGQTPGWIPHQGGLREAWYTFYDMTQPGQAVQMEKALTAEKIAALQSALQGLVESYRVNPSAEETTQKAREFSDALQTLRLAQGAALDYGVLKQELIYNRLDPFGLAWKLYLVTLFLLVMLGFFPALNAQKLYIAVPAFVAGLLIHSYGFFLRCVVAGRPPVTNMYESIIWVSWAVCFFSLVLFAFYKSPVLLSSSSAVAAFALVIAETFPTVLDPTVSPLVPVLRSNLWLTIHVLTITLSYGAFALAWGLGHVVVIQYVKNYDKPLENKMLAQYLYRSLQIGVILLAAGTVLGGVWANYSWGRFWGWDPKETWALIALLGYLAILHCRFVGWLDIFGLAAASVAAFALVVMAWYGVNYVLAAGLHSYGFGGGGAPYVLGTALLDFVLIGALAFRYRQLRSLVKPHI